MHPSLHGKEPSTDLDDTCRHARISKPQSHHHRTFMSQNRESKPLMLSAMKIIALRNKFCLPTIASLNLNRGGRDVTNLFGQRLVVMTASTLMLHCVDGPLDVYEGFRNQTNLGN